MNFFQLILGLAIASGVLISIWQIAVFASKYMIRHAVAPPGLKMLTSTPSGVEVMITNHARQPITAWHRGSGPAVVIIPESEFAASAYTPLWELLCGYGFRVILFQPQSINAADPAFAAQDLEQVLRHLSVQNPILLGHGYGAYTAMYHQAMYPGASRAKGIVSVSGFAGNTYPFQPTYFEKIFRRISKYQRYLSAFGNDASTAGILALKSHTRGYPWKYLAHSWNHISSFYSIPNFDLPVSVLASVNDDILPFSHSAEIAKVFPNAYPCTIHSGAGHMLIWETPSLIVDQVRKLEQVSRVSKKAG